MPPPPHLSLESVLMSRRTWVGLLVTLLVSARGYLLFSVWNGWAAVWVAVQRLHLMGIAVLLGLSLVNYGLRFVRWQAYLHEMGHTVPWKPCGLIYVGGYALTTTPGKVGEAVRSVFLRAWNVPVSHSLAAFASERLADLVGIMALACLGAWSFTTHRSLIGFGWVLILLLWVGLVHGHRVIHQLSPPDTLAHNAWSRLLQRIAQALCATRQCHRPGLVTWVWPMTALAWMAEAWALHLLLGWLGIHCHWLFSFFVYAVAMMAGAFSFLPGGLGGTEAVMVGLLLWHGAEPPAAVAATIVVRLTTLWFAVLLGLAALSILWRQHQPPRTEGAL